MEDPAGPGLALISQAAVVYLLFDNIDFLGSGYRYAKWFGPIDLAIVLIGVGVAFYFKKYKPAKYEQAGPSSTKDCKPPAPSGQPGRPGELG